MVLIRATRRLLAASGRNPKALLSSGPLPDVGPLGTWYANVVSLPHPGRSLVLFTEAETMLSVVAPGRSLRTTLPVFQRRAPALLLRLGLPEPWVEARTDALAEVHVARAGALTVDRTVLGTMNDTVVQIYAHAWAAETFDRLDLDRLEARLADVPLGAIRIAGSSHGRPADAVAALAAA